MSLFHRFRQSGGALLLPRSVADRGTANWPKCARCMRAVDAYGIENETDGRIEIWARCDGVRIDPASGQTIAFAPRVHPVMKASTTILKGPGWSPNRFSDIVRRLAFFSPEGDREWRQDLTPSGVGKRWGAG